MERESYTVSIKPIRYPGFKEFILGQGWVVSCVYPWISPPPFKKKAKEASYRVPLLFHSPESPTHGWGGEVSLVRIPTEQAVILNRKLRANKQDWTWEESLLLWNGRKLRPWRSRTPKRRKRRGWSLTGGGGGGCSLGGRGDGARPRALTFPLHGGQRRQPPRPPARAL